MLDTIAEKLLCALYERMWFRRGLPDEGWAIEQIKLALEEATEVGKETQMKDMAKLWKRVAKKMYRRALWLEEDNNHQRAMASEVPYLRERIKNLEGQIPARTFDVEDYMEIGEET